MRYLLFGVVAMFACDAPTDMKRLEASTAVVQSRVVHPNVVRITVTPKPPAHTAR